MRRGRSHSSTSSGRTDALTLLLRWRYLIITSVAVVSAVRAPSPAVGDDWGFFKVGSQLLLGHRPAHDTAAGGLHLYANYGKFQIGPLALLAAAVLRSRVLVACLIVALLPLVVWLLDDALQRSAHRNHQLTVLIGGSIAAMSWSTLKAWLHPDDALTLLFAALTIWGFSHRRPVVAGVAVGLAVAAKPWGVVMLPLLFLLGSGRRRALEGFTIVAGIAWLPFVIADRGTLSAGALEVYTSHLSVLHLLGVAVNAKPAWVRPTQLLLGVTLAAVVAARGRWPSALLAGVAVRIVLDPGVFSYYSPGLVLGALAWDLSQDRALPLLMAATFLLLGGSAAYHGRWQVNVLLRLGCCTLAVIASVLGPRTNIDARMQTWPDGSGHGR